MTKREVRARGLKSKHNEKKAPKRSPRGGLHRPTLLPGVPPGGWQEWDPAGYYRLNAGVADAWPGAGVEAEGGHTTPRP